jgi:enoyl-CoA hydratase/carnithine racemase
VIPGGRGYTRKVNPTPTQSPPQPLPVERVTDGPGAGAVVVRLEQPGRPVVVLDQDLIRRLEMALQSVPRDAAGLVLASASERVFVAGADLKTISEWDDPQLEKYLAYGSRVFAMLAAFPFPTAAAINGAALGGGLELAMHCDGLIAARPVGHDGSLGKPYPVGLPEAGLGLCPGWGGTNLLPARMDPAEAIKRTASGMNMTFTEAEGFGLFDAVSASPGTLLDDALAWVSARAKQGRMERDGAPLRWIGRPPVAAQVVSASDAVRAELPASESARAVALAVEAGLTRGWDAAVEVERKELVRLRHTPAARAALAAFFAKSKG